MGSRDETGLSTSLDEHGETEVDLTSVVAPNQVKALLYRLEPKMATLPQSSQKLIGTTCALFLKSLLEKSSEGAVFHSDRMVTVESLKRVVDEDFSLPQDLVTSLSHREGKQKLQDVGEFTPGRIRTSTSKRRRSEVQSVKPKAAITSARASMGENFNQDSTQESAAALPASGADNLIEEDDDDYD